MKLKGILLTSALTAMLGVGVFAGVSGNKGVAPVERAEAAVSKTVSKVYIEDQVNSNTTVLAIEAISFSSGYGHTQWRAFLNSYLGSRSSYTTTSGSTQPSSKGWSYMNDNEQEKYLLCPTGAKNFTMIFPEWVTTFSYKAVGNNWWNWFDVNGAAVDAHSGFGIGKQLKSYIYNDNGWKMNVNLDNTAQTNEWGDISVTAIAKYNGNEIGRKNITMSKYYKISSQSYSISGYTFNQWCSDSECTTEHTSLLTSNATVYAKFNENDVYPASTGYYLVGNSAFISEMGKTGPEWYFKSGTRMDDITDGGNNKALYTLTVTQSVTFKAHHYNASTHTEYYVSNTDIDQAAADHGATWDGSGNYVVPAGTYTLYIFVQDNQDRSSLTWGIPLDAFCTEFMDETGEVCDGAATKEADLLVVWGNMSSRYSLLSETDKATLVGATASETGTDVQKVMARYDVIIKNHSTFTDFMNRKQNANYTYKGINVINNMPEESTMTVTVTATVIVSIIAISTAAGFLFLKKKKNF